MMVNPEGLVIQKYLKIKTKKADLVPLVLNNTQREIIKIIFDLLEAGKPIRLWILKSRQEGCSTLIEAIIYAFTSQQENINSLIMADEKDHANNLFDMSKLYHEQLEKDYPHLAPVLKRSNEKKLEFDNIHSQIIIATAENLEAARSRTFSLVHLSEVAYFRNLKEVMKGLNQTVPDLPNTMIIGETTANGMNMFYDEWLRAVQGKSDWTPVFVPWYDLEEYQRPVENGVLYPLDGINFDSDNTLQAFLVEEKRLIDEIGLSQEQINWRRYTIVNKCNGDMNDFFQEYPATWEEAFRSSGRTFFNQDMLKRQVRMRPIAVGDVFYDDRKHVFRDLPEGKVKLYHRPNQYEQYIITIDASEAIGEDEGSILVLNKRLNRVEAVVNGQYPPEVLADVASKLGYWYNTALIAPENKGYGYMVCQCLSQTYGNIYKRVKTKDGKIERTTELGFNTNLNTRPEMLARSAEVISRNSCLLNDADVINQHQTFIINPKTKKAEAAEGKQDGLVICYAIAQQVRHEYPYRPKIEGSVSELSALRRIKSTSAVGSTF